MPHEHEHELSSKGQVPRAANGGRAPFALARQLDDMAFGELMELRAKKQREASILRQLLQRLQRDAEASK